MTSEILSLIWVVSIMARIYFNESFSDYNKKLKPFKNFDFEKLFKDGLHKNKNEENPIK